MIGDRDAREQTVCVGCRNHAPGIIVGQDAVARVVHDDGGFAQPVQVQLNIICKKHAGAVGICDSDQVAVAGVEVGARHSASPDAAFKRVVIVIIELNRLSSSVGFVGQQAGGLIIGPMRNVGCWAVSEGQDDPVHPLPPAVGGQGDQVPINVIFHFLGIWHIAPNEGGLAKAVVALVGLVPVGPVVH